LAEKHGLSLQRIYNLKSENWGRFQQIVQAEKETLQILKHEKFSDLFIMKEAPVMAGYDHIAQTALRRYMELDAASRVYDPETGQTVSVRMSRTDVANMKTFADMWNQAVMAAHELRGRRPGRMDKSLNQWVMLRHTDPPSAEVLEARRKAKEAERAEEAEAEREREAQLQAMRRQLKARRQGIMQDWMATDPGVQEVLQRIEQRYADEAEYEASDELANDELGASLEPVPEPSVTAQVRDETVPEPSPFVASVAVAMRGTLALEFDPESMTELEICSVRDAEMFGTSPQDMCQVGR
jgi:hypothetical protein